MGYGSGKPYDSLITLISLIWLTVPPILTQHGRSKQPRCIFNQKIGEPPALPG